VPRQRLDAEKHRRTTAKAVVVEGFFNKLGFGIVTFAIPLYALSLGLNVAEIGILVAAKAAIQPLVKPLMGIAIDRFGARRGYLTAVSLRFVSTAVLLVADTLAGLLAVRFIQGAASAAQEPASITVLAKTQRDRLGRAFSAVLAARDVAKVSAGAAAGLLLAATGSFTLLWIVVSVIALIPVLVVVAFVRDVAAHGEELPDAEPAPVPDEVARVLRSPTLRLIAGLGLMAGMTAHMTHAMFQVYATEVAGLGPGEIGVIYSLSVASLLAVGPPAGWVADRYGNGLLASSRAVANAVSSIAYLIFPSFAGLLGGRLVDDAGKAAFRPTWASLLGTASRRAGTRGGRVVANLDAVMSIGEALGPVVAGLIWNWAGAAAFLITRAVLGIATEAIFGRRLRAALAGEAPNRRADRAAGEAELTLRDEALPNT